MRYSIEWQDETINAAPEECATVGDLRLFVNERNVTQHLFVDTVGDHVTIALYGMVDGLVHDWWEIVGAREREFSLRNYRTGYLLPDIRLRFDGEQFEFSAHQTAYKNPDVRFWGGASEVLSRREGEDWLCALIEEVLDRLREKGMNETGAALRWRRVKASRRSNESLFCEAAGGLGLDPYRIDDETAGFIEQAEQIFDREPLMEFVSGAGAVDRAKLMSWVMRIVGMKSHKYRLRNLWPIVSTIANDVPPRDSEPAWAAGYRRARAMRRELGVAQHQRIGTFRELAQLLGASRDFNLAPKVNGIHALRREAYGDIHIHVRNQGEFDGAPEGHLFALARAIGDTACFPERQVAPINRLHRAYRQAAGRAFAAEFLAPVDEILSMQDDERDEVSIASEFGVSPRVVEHQIENRERIAEACAA